MKKVFKFFTILLFLIILIMVGFYLYAYMDSVKSTKKVVVVKSFHDGFFGVDEKGELFNIKFYDFNKLNGKDLKKGQEIEIYWHGIIDSFAPPAINNVRKYKILKEKSDIEIPEYAIKKCYNSIDSVIRHVRSITNSGIELRILDTNEIPYEYDFNYYIYKKINVVSNNESDSKVENVPNGGTIIHPSNPSNDSNAPRWEELEIIGRPEERYENIIFDVVDSSYGHYDIEAKYDWTKLYGKLKQGEYKFILTLKNPSNAIHFSVIEIEFDINEEGNINFDAPSFTKYE